MSKMSLIFANNPNKKGFFGKKMCEKICLFFKLNFGSKVHNKHFVKP